MPTSFLPCSRFPFKNVNYTDATDRRSDDRFHSYLPRCAQASPLDSRVSLVCVVSLFRRLLCNVNFSSVRCSPLTPMICVFKSLFEFVGYRSYLVGIISIYEFPVLSTWCRANANFSSPYRGDRRKIDVRSPHVLISPTTTPR